MKVKLEYSLDLQIEKIIQSCTSQVKVESDGQPTIIVLDGGNAIDQAALKRESNKINFTRDILYRVEEDDMKSDK